MLTAALLSTLHLLALAIGIPGVYFRGRALRELATNPQAIDRVLRADNAWGLAALLWLATGALRAFGPFEKGSGFYLHSGPFLVKMGLFGAILALELWPMITLVRWRVRQAKGRPIDTSRAALFFRLNTAELALVIAMPFFASAMARGLGFGWFG